MAVGKRALAAHLTAQILFESFIAPPIAAMFEPRDAKAAATHSAASTAR
jgi:hypothetical protein